MSTPIKQSDSPNSWHSFSSPDKNTSPPKLDPSFASILLEKEMTLESSPSSELVNEIIELYTQAIEFYEYRKDPKYLDYQNRMHQMLVKPQVLSSLSQPKTPARSPEESPTSYEEKVRARKQETESFKITLYSGLNKHEAPKTSHSTQRIMQRNKNRTKEVVRRTMVDFKSQDSALERRLASRKQKKLTRSMALSTNTSFVDNRMFDCNLSDIDEEIGMDSPSNNSRDVSGNLDALEKGLEQIMEAVYNEKSQKITQIKVNYQSQFNELESQGDFGKMIIEKMKAQMNQEIEEVTKELNKKRSEQINQLKQLYKY